MPEGVKPYHSLVLGNDASDFGTGEEQSLGTSILPRPDAIRLILESLVELFAQLMSTFAHNQASVVRSVWEQIHQTLQAPEPGPRAVLVLVGPRRVRFQVLAVGEAHVDGVEGHNQVLGLVDFLERTDNAGLRANSPCEGLMR